jgi:hypothetical protein
MHRSLLVPLLAVAAAFRPATAQDLKMYPGSVRDQQAAPPTEVYTTSDKFDQVYAFYKSVYREAPNSLPTPKLPSGKPVRWAFFILDDAKSLARSRHWLKIQTPYILTVGEGMEYKGIRDICVIQSIHR